MRAPLPRDVLLTCDEICQLLVVGGGGGIKYTCDGSGGIANYDKC